MLLVIAANHILAVVDRSGAGAWLHGELKSTMPELPFMREHANLSLILTPP